MSNSEELSVSEKIVALRNSFDQVHARVQKDGTALADAGLIRKRGRDLSHEDLQVRGKGQDEEDALANLFDKLSGLGIFERVEWGLHHVYRYQPENGRFRHVSGPFVR